MKRRLQFLLGLILAAAGVIVVLFLGRASQPVTYEVPIVIQRIPAYTPLSNDAVMVDTQSLSDAVAEKYVLADELEEMVAQGAVVVENLHPGQPLMREQVATGADAEGLSRLAVALDDPDLVILSVPVEGDLPSVTPGDAVALFFAAGQVRANQLVTHTVEGEADVEGEEEIAGTAPLTPTTQQAWAYAEEPEVVTITTELEMPLAKWVASGVVYRLNRERRENPNYGAPGMEGEPRYIEGPITALDVVVHRDDVESVAFALAHGQVRLGVLPAVAKAAIEDGTMAPSRGMTWSDFEDRFFVERGAVDGEGGRQ